MRAFRGKGPKIITVEAPPRHGKTELLSKFLPCYFLGRYPDRRVILTSYSDSLAKYSGRTALNYMKNYGPAWWNVRVRGDVQSAGEWELCEGGGMLSVGIGGPLTGRGADLMVIDDTLKNAQEAISDKIRHNQQEWFESTAFTRIEPGGVLVMVMTRWHDDDLIGWLHKRAEEMGVEVVRLRFPALSEGADVDQLGREAGEPLWPDKRPLRYLLERKNLLGDDYWWNSLYQQKPGQYSAVEWPNSYFEEPFWADTWPHAFDHRIVTMDPSKGRKKGDPSAIVFLGLHQGTLWVDADIALRPVPRLVEDTIAFSRRYEAGLVGIEANSFQELLAPEIDRCVKEMGLAPLPISLVNNQVNKQLRIGRLGPYLARHHFRFRPTPGCKLLVQQLRGFPFASHDDGPDALEMAVRSMNWLANLPVDEQDERVSA